INQLIPENPDCEFCSSRREMQQRNLADIRELYEDISLTEVPLFDNEIRGIDGLAGFGRILTGE
ncbi:MAG: ArsA-related P-loop ATPase, partial [Promethearchaeota archaeon]